MQRKFAGYTLLSFLSFGIFTTVFHTVVNAQASETLLVATTPPAATPTVSPTQKPHIASQNVETKTVVYKLQPLEETTPIMLLPTISPTTPPIPTITPTTAPTVEPTVVPTATPLPQPVLSLEQLEPLFEKYANEYHIDKEDLKRIAKCESGYNNNADTGLYAGMYQFHSQTWIANRNAMGLDPNPELRKNAEESIRTAAYKISNGGRNAWPNC